MIEKEELNILKCKIIYSTICLVLIILLLVSSLYMTVNAKEEKITDYTAKLDSILLVKLNEMKDDDTIAVSVWFTDIDKSNLKERVITESQNNATKRNSIAITQDTIELLFYDIESEENIGTKTLTELEAEYSSVTSEQLQTAIQLEREVAAEVYEQHNQMMLDNLLTSSTFSTSKSITSKDDSDNVVKYVCKYAPNVDMVLSKQQIMSIIEQENVEEVNYRSTNATATVVDYSVLENSDNTTTLDELYFSSTDIATARDVWGLNGNGMNIGIIESGGYVIDDLEGLTDDETNGNDSEEPQKVKNIYLDERIGESPHASSIAYLMVGETDDYIGAVPNAKLFVTAIFGDVEKIKIATDELIEDGVFVISSSCGFYEEGISTAYYSDTAKWYDYMSLNRNVHYALCSGNYRNNNPFQVPHSNNAYNAVVVGNCNSNGDLYMGEIAESYLIPPYSEASMYSTGVYASYKPEIVAPGTSLKIPMYSEGIIGTSYSTPLVASAMLQLAQASSILHANPTLMKAVIISSSKIKNSMAEESMYSIVGSTNIACSRPYGAGMLSVTNAYTSLIEKGYYITDTFSPYSTLASFNRNITKSIGKTIRVGLAWDKVVSVENENVFSSVSDEALDYLMLRVTTPSGLVYTSSYQYDNKQMITFESTENGTYTFAVVRNNIATSNSVIDYSISWSVQ